VRTRRGCRGLLLRRVVEGRGGPSSARRAPSPASGRREKGEGRREKGEGAGEGKKKKGRPDCSGRPGHLQAPGAALRRGGFLAAGDRAVVGHRGVQPTAHQQCVDVRLLAGEVAEQLHRVLAATL